LLLHRGFERAIHEEKERTYPGKEGKKHFLRHNIVPFVWHLSESFGIALAFFFTARCFLQDGVVGGEERQEDEKTLEVKRNRLHEL
jgi:hypothetical protein